MILTDQKSIEVAERLRAAVEEALSLNNVSARRASLDVVGHDGLIRDIRAGRIPSVDRIEALFNYLGLEFYFGPRRRAVEHQSSPALANLPLDEAAPSGYLTIPWAEARVGRGSSPVAFSRSWIEAHDLVPDFLQAAEPDTIDIHGRTSLDTLALLDTRMALRRGHGLFCFRESGRLTVANVTFRGTLTVLHSARSEDAPRFLDQAAFGQITVLGKVAWLGQGIPFKGTVR